MSRPEPLNTAPPPTSLAFNTCAFFVGSAGIRRVAISAADALLNSKLAPRLRFFAPSCRREEMPARFLSKTDFFWAPDPRRGTAFNNLFWTALLSIHLRLKHAGAVVYSPLETYPLIPFAHSIITAHDCYADHFGDPRKGGRPGIGRRLNLRQLKRSHVLSVSEFTTRELAHLHHICTPQVQTVQNWLDREYNLTPAPDHLAKVRSQLNLPASFWLYVGGFRLNKNLPFLFEAYAKARERNSQCPPLVVAGRYPEADTPFSGPFHAAMDRHPGLRSHIILPGFVSDEDLPALYKLASLVICPSSYEGFGFPVIEALAVGAPVIAARATSLTELGLPETSLFSPTDHEELVTLLLGAIDQGTQKFQATLPQRFLPAAGETRFCAAIEHALISEIQLR